MTATTYLFTSYDTKRLTTHKVSISDGKQLSIIGHSNIKVTNGTLEDLFHVQVIPINLLYIYACQKGYKFEAYPDKYVLKDINHNFKIVSHGPIDHNSRLYKFIGLNSNKNKYLYSYVAHVDEQSKLWHEILGHLNYGKMQMLTKMVHGVHSISSTKGVCESCVLGKYWSSKEQLQLIRRDICGPLETPYLYYVVYFLTFIDDYSRKSWVSIFET